MNRLERLTPAYQYSVAHHSKTVNTILMSHVQERLAKEQENGDRKTVVDLCFKDSPEEFQDKKTSSGKSGYMDAVLSQVKVFILAGHHTTAQAM